MEFAAAKCPECGGQLQVPVDRERVKCLYCGFDVFVAEAIGRVAAPSVAGLLALAETAADSGQVHDAFDYYGRVLEMQPTNAQAWVGRASAAGWASTVTSPRLDEMLAGFARALDLTPEGDRAQLAASIAHTIGSVAETLHGMARDYLRDALGESTPVWDHYRQLAMSTLGALTTAQTYAPDEAWLYARTVDVCQSMLNGASHVSTPFRVRVWGLGVPVPMPRSYRLTAAEADYVTAMLAYARAHLDRLSAVNG